jgi:hypothetical protein
MGTVQGIEQQELMGLFALCKLCIVVPGINNHHCCLKIIVGRKPMNLIYINNITLCAMKKSFAVFY